MLLAYHRLQILCLLPQLWESSPKMLSGFLLILKIELCFSTNPCNVGFSENAIYFKINEKFVYLWSKKIIIKIYCFLVLHARFNALTLMIGKLFFLRGCISCSIHDSLSSLLRVQKNLYAILLSVDQNLRYEYFLPLLLTLYLAIYVSLCPYQPKQMSL